MNKPLILIVEDDAPVRNLMVTALKTNDYRYLAAPDGKTAVMEASSHNPDIVLLDLGLPDMDGVEVIRTIRTWSNMPVIVISARSEDSDKIQALDAGADDYLTKPFSVEELLARLRATQRRLAYMVGDAPSAGSVFVNGKLQVDYAGGCASLDGQELHLTPMEYKLLCLLSRNVGQRRGLPAGVHGDSAEEAGVQRGFSPVYPDTHRRGIPDDEGGIIPGPRLIDRSRQERGR